MILPTRLKVANYSGVVYASDSKYDTVIRSDVAPKAGRSFKVYLRQGGQLFIIKVFI